MNKYLVIGNPIDHSLSPKLHNYWFREKQHGVTLIVRDDLSVFGAAPFPRSAGGEDHAAPREP